MDSKLDIKELILFILHHCPLDTGLKKLNKLAFLLEWSYIFDRGQELTNAQFAAIQMGPVIDDYKNILMQMQTDNLVIKNNHQHTHIYTPKRPANIPIESREFLVNILNKYKDLTGTQLEHFTHELASYAYTVRNNQYGKIIDKSLACLEEVLLENENLELKQNEDSL